MHNAIQYDEWRIWSSKLPPHANCSIYLYREFHHCYIYNLNSSLNVFCFKEKRFTQFIFKNQACDRVLHFKCLIIVLNQIFAVNNKAPRRFNSSFIPVNLKFNCLQIYNRYSYILLDPEILWVISELKTKNSNNYCKHQLFFSQTVFYRGRVMGFGYFESYF